MDSIKMKKYRISKGKIIFIPPRGYRFLRYQILLPLRSVNTIRRNLLAIKIGCGFDLNFFKLLVKKFNSKSEHQKLGCLIYDEIILRKSINFDLYWTTDYGDEIPTKINSKSCFSHNVAKLGFYSYKVNISVFLQFIFIINLIGAYLTKLIVKAILLLEKAGRKVVGLTGDGATTNRNMLKLLGINVNEDNFKNYFNNPFYNTRKVYVFSDAPHLMKTVHNRLYDKKQLKVINLKLHPEKSYIKWEHYYNVYKNEELSLT
ncbi:Uncharacterized protein FWK35_00021406, partial [Aphis craccivora]